MRLRAVLLATVAVAALARPVRAEPITLAIAAVAEAGSIGAAIAGAGTVAALAINIAVPLALSAGLSFLSSALQNKKSAATQSSAGEPLSGVETTVQIGGDVPRQIAIGVCGVKGQLVYHNTSGASNEFHQRVFALSDWRCDSLQAIWVNGQRYPCAVQEVANGRTRYLVEGLSNYLYIGFWPGDQIEADPELIAAASPPDKWTAQSKLTGITYAAVFFTYAKDADLYQNGIPDILFELKGAKLYDWRQDSTNAGSGPQRWDEPSTWVWSDNPVVAIYNYLRGFYLDGDQRVIGMGVPAYDIIHETFTAAANACDEMVTLDDGGQEKRYRCAIILTADENVTHATTLDALRTCFAGYLYDYGGSYYAQAGVAQSSVETITDDMLVLGIAVTFASKRGRADLVNRYNGQFLDPSIGFQAQSYNPQISATGLVKDGEELSASLDLLSVPAQGQAERIAKIRLRENRLQATAGVTLGFDHLALQVGDWITWDSARFGSRQWRIEGRSIDAASRRVSLQLSEIDATAFSWSAVEQGPLPALPVRLTTATLMSTVALFALQATTVASDDGATEMPAILFTWAPVEDPGVDQVIIEFRRAGSTNALRVTDPTPEDGKFLLTSGILPATEYEARATIRTTPARPTTWTPWVSITSEDAFLLAIIATISDQVRKDIEQGPLKDEVHSLKAQIAELAAAAATEAGTAYESRTFNKLQLEGKVSASFRDVINLDVSPTSALATRFTSLQTVLDDHSATLTTYGASIDGIKVSFGVTGTIDGDSGGFVFSGVKRADGVGGEFSMAFDVSTFVITNGATNKTPFAITADKVVIGDLIVDTIHIREGAVSNLASASGSVGSGYSQSVTLTVRAGGSVRVGVSIIDAGASIRAASYTVPQAIRSYLLQVDGTTYKTIYVYDPLVSGAYLGDAPVPGGTSVYQFKAAAGPASFGMVVTGLSSGPHTFSVYNAAPFPMDVSIDVTELAR